MGKENREVTQRIARLVEIINHVNQLSPFSPHALEVFNIARANLSSDNLDAMAKFEHYTFTLVTNHLNSAAEQFQMLAWEKANQPANDPLETLDSIVRTFEKQLNEQKNEAVPEATGPLKNNNKVKKKRKHRTVKIETETNEHSPILEEILQLKLAFDEEKKQHAVFPLAETAFDPALENDYYLQQWKQVYIQLNMNSAHLIRTLNIQYDNQIPSSGYFETLRETLKKAINDMKALNENRNRLLLSAKKRQPLLSPSTNNREELQELLDKVRTKLKNATMSFFEKFITIDFGSIHDEYTRSCIILLKEFILKLGSNFQLHPTTFDKDTAVELQKKLLTHLDAENSEKTSSIESNSFYDLMEKGRTLLFGKTDSKLETGTIEDVLDRLLNVGDESQSAPSLLKKKIAATYHILALMDEFYIDSIQKYHCLKKTTYEQHQYINEQIRIKKENAEHNTKTLQDYLIILPQKNHSPPDVITALEIQENYQVFLDEMNLFSLTYPLERKDILNIASPMTRLQALNKAQQSSLKQLDAFEEKLQGLSTRTDKTIEALAHYYQMEKNCIKSELDDALLNAKAALLFEKKYQLSSSPGGLKQFLTHQKAIESEITEQLQPQVLALENIIDFKDNLNVLKADTAKAIKILAETVDTIKKQLIDSSSSQIESIKARQKEINEPNSISSINPFAEALSAAKKASETAVNKLNCHYNKLTKTKGTEIEDWSLMLDKHLLTAEESLTQRDEAINSVKLIEHRLHSSAYLTSREILEKLEAEFTTIFNEKKEKLSSNQLESWASLTIEQNLDENQQTQLCTLDPRLGKLMAMHADFTKINNDYISKDLYRLNKCSIDLIYPDTIYRENTLYFELIPDGSLRYTFLACKEGQWTKQVDHIDKSLLKKYQLHAPLSMEQLRPLLPLIWYETGTRPLQRRNEDWEYLEKLKQNVSEHLRNDRMENLSDGIRNPFIQWIRIHICKPLQALRPTLDPNDPNLFFRPVTIGACKTEKDLIDMGNRVYSQLGSCFKSVAPV